jgi:hypothetical protein
VLRSVAGASRRNALMNSSAAPCNRCGAYDETAVAARAAARPSPVIGPAWILLIPTRMGIAVMQGPGV